MGSIKDKERKLFEKWKGIVPEPFIEDGLMNESAYLVGKRKIIFVLKDAYGSSNELVGWNLCEKVLNEAFDWNDRTWLTIIRWTYGLFNLEENCAWSEIEQITGRQPEKRHIWDNMLRSIGSMNIKKSMSSTAITKMADFKTHANNQDNLKLLREQWKFYNPDITICGGTEVFAAMQRVFDNSCPLKRQTRKGTAYWRLPTGQLFIEACHPAARCPDALKYFMVLDAVHEILSMDSVKSSGTIA